MKTLITVPEYAAAVRNATNLGELLAALRLLATVPADDRDAADRAVDWTALPTFGGARPDDTDGVWSWDEERQIVGTCPADLRMELRTPAGLAQ